VPHSSIIKVGGKDLNFRKFSEWSEQVRYPIRTSPPDFFSSNFYDHFERNLLTVSPIDSILLLLALEFYCDHVFVVGKCFHHLLA
jgi:hypothetical protein